MSISLMTMARKTALPTNLKFTLMALADWADDNGSSCYPSVYELSEYLTCSERTVQRLLRELENDGWISVVGNSTGGGAPRSYSLDVARLTIESETEDARRDLEQTTGRPKRKARISGDLRRRVFERDAYRCKACSGYEHLSCDHIVPESIGGPSTFENLQTLCRSCNSKKGAKL